MLPQDGRITTEIDNIAEGDPGKRPDAPDLAQSFMERFAGNERHHGERHATGTPAPGKKAEGDCFTKPGPATLELWRKHLAGELGLGVVPIRDDGTCVWGCIDLDVYDIDIYATERRVKDEPLVVCRSKSGGVHAFLFTTEPVPAALMQQKLVQAAAALGHPGVEVFPKQHRLDAARGDQGNWLNMPYFNDDVETMRYCIGNGASLTAEEFLAHAERKAISRADLERLSLSIPADPDDPIKDGPPCLQALCRIGIDQGSRNNGLYNLGVYYKKAHPDDWEQRLEDANRRFIEPPLHWKEVGAIIKSLSKKSYNYKCGDQPICGHCEKATCLTRRFGISDGKDDLALPEGYPEIADALVYRALGGESQFHIHVNGVKVGPLTAEDMVSQRRFGVRIMNDMQIFVPRIKDAAFTAFINRLMANARKEDLPEDATPKGMVLAHLIQFLTGRAQCEDPWDIRYSNKPWRDHETGFYWFKLKDFADYLERCRFFMVKRGSLGGVLRELGVLDKSVLWPTGKAEGEMKQMRLWCAMDVEPRDDRPLPLPSFGGDF